MSENETDSNVEMDENDSDEEICNFCQKSIICCPKDKNFGALKYTPSGQFCHLLCALWSDGCKVDKFLNVTSLDLLTSIGKNECYICNTKYGLLSNCKHADCSRYFHITCANLSSKTPKEIEKESLFCTQHYKQNKVLQKNLKKRKRITSDEDREKLIKEENTEKDVKKSQDANSTKRVRRASKPRRSNKKLSEVGDIKDEEHEEGEEREDDKEDKGEVEEREEIDVSPAASLKSKLKSSRRGSREKSTDNLKKSNVNTLLNNSSNLSPRRSKNNDSIANKSAVNNKGVGGNTKKPDLAVLFIDEEAPKKTSASLSAATAKFDSSVPKINQLNNSSTSSGTADTSSLFFNNFLEEKEKQEGFFKLFKSFLLEQELKLKELKNFLPKEVSQNLPKKKPSSINSKASSPLSQVNIPPGTPTTTTNSQPPSVKASVISSFQLTDLLDKSFDQIENSEKLKKISNISTTNQNLQTNNSQSTATTTLSQQNLSVEKFKALEKELEILKRCVEKEKLEKIILKKKIFNFLKFVGVINSETRDLKKDQSEHLEGIMKKNFKENGELKEEGEKDEANDFGELNFSNSEEYFDKVLESCEKFFKFDDKFRKDEYEKFFKQKNDGPNTNHATTSYTTNSNGEFLDKVDTGSRDGEKRSSVGANEEVNHES
ncbi:nuA3 HAT complex component nto1 [Lobulomyces angularis]|nr:nuA3 HAT complex component nto1 [Lobulomyces angularis]